MLELAIEAGELFNENTGEFVNVDRQTLQLEHSLYSIAKWESKWKKPFLSNSRREEKTAEEMIDYIRCMMIDETADPMVVYALNASHMKQINDYINDPMTATWFKEKDRPSNEIVTSEIVYYWMVSAQVPFECQYWHFNRLMTLLKVVSIKNQPAKKMSKSDILKQNRAINHARRKPHV